MLSRTSIGVRSGQVQDSNRHHAEGISWPQRPLLHNLGAKVISAIDEAWRRVSADLDLDMCSSSMSPTRFVFEFLDAVERQLGPIDVLVNAGIMPVGRIVVRPGTRESWTSTSTGYDLGVASWRRSRWLPGRGHVINVASLAGKSTP